MNQHLNASPPAGGVDEKTAAAVPDTSLAWHEHHLATQEAPRVGGVDEKTIAAALGMSVGWLRADRYGKRTIPFFKLGGRVRYDLESVRASLKAREQGGKPAWGKA